MSCIRRNTVPTHVGSGGVPMYMACGTPSGLAAMVGRRALSCASVSSWASSMTITEHVPPRDLLLVRVEKRMRPPLVNLISCLPGCLYGSPSSMAWKSG